MERTHKSIFHIQSRKKSLFHVYVCYKNKHYFFQIRSQIVLVQHRLRTPDSDEMEILKIESTSLTIKDNLRKKKKLIKYKTVRLYRLRRRGDFLYYRSLECRHNDSGLTRPIVRKAQRKIIITFHSDVITRRGEQNKALKIHLISRTHNVEINRPLSVPCNPPRSVLAAVTTTV